MDETFARWFCVCGRSSYASYCRCGKKRPLGSRSGSGPGTEAGAEAALAPAVVVVPTASKGWCPVLPAEVIDDYIADLARTATVRPPERTYHLPGYWAYQREAHRLAQQAELEQKRPVYDYLDELAKAAE